MMNPISFFKFLETRESRQIPFSVKWLTGTLSAEDLKVANLFFGAQDARKFPRLPDNLWVTGDLILPVRPMGQIPKLFQLPDNLRVDGKLDIAFSEMRYEQLPKNMRVKHMDITGTSILNSITIKELFERFPDLEVIQINRATFLRSEIMQ